MHVAEPPVQSASRFVVAALFLVFGSLGASASAIPATLPAVIARHPDAASTLAAAVPVLFAGVMTGVVLSIVAARPPVQLAVTGALVQAAAFAVLIALQDPQFLVALAGAVGVGFGLVEASATRLVRDLDHAATARRLTALTGTVALVAAALPLLVSLAPPASVTVATYATAAGVALASALALAVAAILQPSRPTPPEPAQPHDQAPTPRGAIALAALALALAVGAESALAGSSAVIPFVLLGADPAQAAAGTSAFWILLAGGRFAASSAIRLGVPAGRCLGVALCIAALALAAAAAAAQTAPVGSVIAIAIAVVAIGPVYSLVIGMAIAVARARWVVGALIASGSAGGATVPLLLLVAGLGAADGRTWLVLAVVIAATGSVLALPRWGGARTERSTDRATRIGS